MMLLILNQIHGFDDIGMMQGRRDAEFGSELLDILLLGLVLPPFPEFLDGAGRDGDDKHNLESVTYYSTRDSPSRRKVSLLTDPTCVPA